MTTATKLKATKKKVALTTPAGAANSSQCADCVKANGLAILPLVTGLLPNRLLPGDMTGIPEQFQINAPLRDLSKALSAADLKHHWYYMRALPAGYLYLLLPDDTWQSYLVDKSGLLRQMPPLNMASPADSVEPMDQSGACRSPEHNPTALQYIVLDPDKTPSVWMAFSRYRWSQQVLDDYREDKDGSRNQRMTRLNVAAAARGELGIGSAVPNGQVVTAQLGKHVADYGAKLTRTLIDNISLEHLHPRGERVVPPYAQPQSDTEKLATHMAEVSKKTPVNSGIFLVLDDVVGHAMQLNYLRNRTAADMCELEGIGDKEKMRRRVVAECIEGIRRNAELNPGPWYAKHYGPERYLKHIDQAAWQDARRESAALKELKQRIPEISEDFCTVIQSSSWKQQQRTDFSDHPDSALSHEKMVAYCLAGSGQTRREQEQLWDPVLALEPNAPDNWLARSLGGLSVSYLDYLAQTPGEQDDAYNAANEAQDLVAGFLGNGVKKIESIRTAIRARRAANVNTASLIETSAGHLFRLRQQNVKAHRKLVRQVTLALITRDDVVPTPTRMQSTWQQVVQKWSAVLLGDPRVLARAPIGVTQGSTVGLSELRKPALSGAVQGAVVLAPPSTRKESVATIAWVVERMEQGGKLDYEHLRKLRLTDLDLTAQAATRPTQNNPMLQNQLKRLGAQADIGLSAGALFFQIMQAADIVKQFSEVRDPGTKEWQDLTIGLTYSVIGTIGAGMELAASVQALRGVDKAVVGVMMRRAAAVGAVAGVIDGAYTIYKGYRKVSDGDLDSGYWTMGAGAFFMVAGVASYGLGGVAAASFAGGSATGIAGLMGPVGWALLLVAALGMGLYFAWQAFATDDENLLPVEYWLDNGVFGKGAFRKGLRASKNPYVQGGQVPPFTSLEEEVMALNRVVLVAQASFGDARGSYGGLGSYQIDLPRYAKGARLEVQFHAYQDRQRENIGELHCEDGKEQPSRYQLSNRLTGMHQGPTLRIDKELGTARIEGMFATVNKSGKFVRDAVEWVVESVSGQDVPDALYADSFGMTLKYWPNRDEMPDLVSEFAYPAPRT
ncbi:toxin VasX [Pseudomonas aeruginosa]